MDGARAATEWPQHHMHWNLIDGTTSLRNYKWMEPERLLSGPSIICIGTLLMVPHLSALSLALCHEALEGGGNHKMDTSIAKK